MMSNVELLGSLRLMMGSYCAFYDLCVFLQLHGEFGYLYNQRLISKWEAVFSSYTFVMTFYSFILSFFGETPFHLHTLTNS